jgi:ketoreductase RED2
VAAVPHLRARGAGCVVNVSSLAGSRLSGSSIPYAVSKAAVNHLTRWLAKVLGPQVRVNAVAPGLIDTPWIDGMDEFADQVTRIAPLRRLGGADDVAEVVLALISARYVTGEVVLVDGGLHMV